MARARKLEIIDEFRRLERWGALLSASERALDVERDAIAARHDHDQHLEARARERGEAPKRGASPKRGAVMKADEVAKQADALRDAEKRFEQALAAFRRDAKALVDRLQGLPKEHSKFVDQEVAGKVISRLRGLIALHQLATTDVLGPLPEDRPWEPV